MKRVWRMAMAGMLLSTGWALAQLSSQYADWAKGPESFLLTKEESKEWKQVTSDEAAKRFVDLFWARRDPDLSTPANEVRAEFERRVQYADENFATDRRRGALTDRGKVLALLGMPLRRYWTSPGRTVRPEDSAAGSLATDDIQTRIEIWEYSPNQLPVDIRGPQLVVGFYEAKLGREDYVLDRSLPNSSAMLRALAKAPEGIVRHPDLTEVPESYRTAAVLAPAPASAIAPAHLSWLDAEPPAWPQDALLLTEPGVAAGGARPLWVHVELPSGSAKLDVLTGRVTGADGAVLSTFEVPAEPLALESTTVYHLAVPVPAGGAKLELAGGAGEKAVFVKDVPVEIPPVQAGSPWVSPPWFGRQVTQEPDSKVGDAFNFGGWHLIPNTSGRLARGQELPYFGFVTLPGGAQPNLSASLNVYSGSEKLAGPLQIALAPSRIANDLWMYGDALNLSGLPGSGKYRLELTIEDKVSGAKTNRAVDLQVTQ